MPLWHSGRLLLFQDVLLLLLPHQVDVSLVDCGRGGCGGGLDLLERPGRCAELVERRRLAGRHRLEEQGRLLLLLLQHHLLWLRRWLRRHDARLRPSLLQDLLRSAQSLAHVEVGVPESLRRLRENGQLVPLCCESNRGEELQSTWAEAGLFLGSHWSRSVIR